MRKPSKKSQDVVLLVHGIRTRASWYEMVQKVLQDHTRLRVVPVKYEYFDTFRFLCPWFTRSGPVKRFIREYRDIKLSSPSASISVIAHSFGTYVVVAALERETDVVLDKIILCGSIVSSKFRVADFRAQLGTKPILNDCGTHDILPVIAKSVTAGFGSTGTFGFGTTDIRDRFSKFTHSSFFNAQFIADYWVPFLNNGTIKGTDWEINKPTPPYWQSLIGFLPAKVLIPVIGLGLFFWPNISGSANYPRPEIDNQIYISNWVDSAQLYAKLRIRNNSFSQKQFFVTQSYITSVVGNVRIPLTIDTAVTCGGSMPPTQVILVAGWSSITCEYSFVGNYSTLSRYGDEINRIVAKYQNLQGLAADPSRVLLTSPLLENLVEANKTQMQWTLGKWKLEVGYASGPPNGERQEIGTQTANFSISETEIDYFHKASSRYGSGIGVFYAWRNYEPNGWKGVIGSAN